MAAPSLPFCPRSFDPTVEELITYFLRNQILGMFDFGSTPIVELDMYGKDSAKNPWELFRDELPWQRGDKYGRKLFVFTVLSNVGKTPKSSNKQKTRVAGDGSWHVNGKEKPVVDDSGNRIGYRRALTFKSNSLTVGCWNMDEFSIDPAAFPQELQGHELECQNLVLCRISFKNPTEDVELSSKKRKSVVLDDDHHSCIMEAEQPSDLRGEASSSKRQKVAVSQEQTAHAPDYFDLMSDSEFVDRHINFNDLF